MLGTLNIDGVKTRIVLDAAGDCEAVTLLVGFVLPLELGKVSLSTVDRV